MDRDTFLAYLHTITDDESGLAFLQTGTRLSNQELKDLLDRLDFSSKESSKNFTYKHTDHKDIITFEKGQLDDPAYQTAGQAMRILKEVLVVDISAGEVSEAQKKALLKKLGVKDKGKKNLLETIENSQKASIDETVQAVLQGKRNPNQKGRVRMKRRRGFEPKGSYSGKNPRDDAPSS